MSVSLTPTPQSHFLLGVRVHHPTRDQALALLAQYAASEELHHVVTVNPEYLVMARSAPEFQATLNQADLALADGVGIVWASWFLGWPLPERLPGVDLVDELSSLARERGYRVFLLGAVPGVAEATARVLTERYPGLIIAGTFSGSPALAQDAEIVALVNAAKPHFLFVAFGAPHQDLWIHRNRQRLKVQVAIGVGGAFDFLSGRVPRAPSWMQAAGLEWLFRLIQEPWRWRRMLRLPLFVWLVFLQRIRGAGPDTSR